MERSLAQGRSSAETQLKPLNQNSSWSTGPRLLWLNTCTPSQRCFSHRACLISGDVVDETTGTGESIGMNGLARCVCHGPPVILQPSLNVANPAVCSPLVIVCLGDRIIFTNAAVLPLPHRQAFPHIHPPQRVRGAVPC